MGEENSHGAGLIYIGLGMTVAMAPLTMLTASGVLERHPELNFVLVECGIGWLAWYLNVLDELYDKRHMWQQPKLSLKPSEYWKRQGYVTFGDDEVGLRNRGHYRGGLPDVGQRLSPRRRNFPAFQGSDRSDIQ